MKIFDTFGAFDDFVSDPTKYGLSNVADACGNPNAPCSNDIDHALFWDGIHPTTYGHQLLAERFLALAVPVPEPSTYAMFLVGLIGCGWAARWRRG